MDLSKKDSNISSMALSPSSSSSLSQSQISKEIKEKEKKIKSILDLNSIESYPIIDYGSKYSPEEEITTIFQSRNIIMNKFSITKSIFIQCIKAFS